MGKQAYFYSYSCKNPSLSYHCHQFINYNIHQLALLNLAVYAQGHAMFIALLPFKIWIPLNICCLYILFFIIFISSLSKILKHLDIKYDYVCMSIMCMVNDGFREQSQTEQPGKVYFGFTLLMSSPQSCVPLPPYQESIFPEQCLSQCPLNRSQGGLCCATSQAHRISFLHCFCFPLINDSDLP